MEFRVTQVMERGEAAGQLGLSHNFITLYRSARPK